MKKVLIISSHFFEKEVIGSIRIRGLYKYLSDFGWNPTILTVQPEKSVQIPESVYITPFSHPLVSWKKRIGLNCNLSVRDQINLKSNKNKKNLVDLIFNIWEEIFFYPDAQIGWYNEAIKLGSEILSNDQFDVILSSSMPYTTHIISKNLSEKFGIPWTADFRDLWTQNHYYHYSTFRHFFENRLEIRTLSQAYNITTVSEPLANSLKELHKNKQVYSIPNGFDPEQIKNTIFLNNKFSIVYTGVLYKGRRDPELLFRVLNNMIVRRELEPLEIKIDFYGSHEGWLQEDIKKYNLQNIVTMHGQVSRDISIAEQCKAQMLLLLTWNDPAEKGVYTGKLFDYLAACRPIISMGYTEGGVVKDLLNQTQAGVHVSNEEELRQYLLTAYREFKNCGAVTYHGINTEVMKYSHREMAKKFAEVLEKISE